MLTRHPAQAVLNLPVLLPKMQRTETSALRFRKQSIALASQTAAQVMRHARSAGATAQESAQLKRLSTALPVVTSMDAQDNTARLVNVSKKRKTATMTTRAQRTIVKMANALTRTSKGKLATTVTIAPKMMFAPQERAWEQREYVLARRMRTAQQ